MHWSEMNSQQKQMMIRLAVLAVLGIILLLIGGTMDKREPAEPELVPQKEEHEMLQNTAASPLEQQLADTLMQVKGAGYVTVQITLYDSGRKEYAHDVQRTERTTEDTADANRKQTIERQEQQTVVQMDGQADALLVTEYMPEICGVLIVADGAGQAAVQEQLLQAAATLLQISAGQILVLPGNGGE